VDRGGARGRWVDVRFKALAAEPRRDAVMVELAVVGETVDGGGAWGAARNGPHG